MGMPDGRVSQEEEAATGPSLCGAHLNASVHLIPLL